MAGPIGESCGSCYFFNRMENTQYDDEKDPKGHCYLLPPKIVGTGNFLTQGYPSVLANSFWCGEYKSKLPS